MRALFTTQPGVGHLRPLLPVAEGLRQRGHEVAFASSRAFASEIEEAGFPAFTATLGTVFNQPALFAAIIDGLAREPLNLVVTVGRNQDPEQFGPQPSNVHIERWLPQALVLPRCDAVVTHGGYGTLTAALTLGVPLVLVPISADQPLNAARCAAIGVGRVTDPRERTPAAIRAATQAVLADRRYRRAAQRVARETRRRPGLDHALDLVEALARDRSPQRSPSTGRRQRLPELVDPRR